MISIYAILSTLALDLPMTCKKLIHSATRTIYLTMEQFSLAEQYAE